MSDNKNLQQAYMNSTTRMGACQTAHNNVREPDLICGERFRLFAGRSQKWLPSDFLLLAPRLTCAVLEAVLRGRERDAGSHRGTFVPRCAYQWLPPPAVDLSACVTSRGSLVPPVPCRSCAGAPAAGVVLGRPLVERLRPARAVVPEPAAAGQRLKPAAPVSPHAILPPPFGRHDAVSHSLTPAITNEPTVKMAPAKRRRFVSCRTTLSTAPPVPL
jgi:hypothetical protein|eukprot:COSAG06_NODE_757_length_12510_cov_69.462529_13_plen_216_part_00